MLRISCKQFWIFPSRPSHCFLYFIRRCPANKISMDLLESARAPPAACSSSEQAELWSWTNYEWPNKKQRDCEGCDTWAFSFKLLHAPNCFDLTVGYKWGWYLHQLTQVAKQQGLASLSKTRMTQRWRVLLTHSLQMLSDFHHTTLLCIVDMIGTDLMRVLLLHWACYFDLHADLNGTSTRIHHQNTHFTCPVWHCQLAR